MYRTKVTRKGQITLPADLREKLDLSAGSVVGLDLEDGKIVVKKPKTGPGSLFGAWKDMTDRDVKKMKSIWRDWDEKDFARL